VTAAFPVGIELLADFVDIIGAALAARRAVGARGPGPFSEHWTVIETMAPILCILEWFARVCEDLAYDGVTAAFPVGIELVADFLDIITGAALAARRAVGAVGPGPFS